MTNSPVLLKNLLSILDEIASFSLAESWDNVGLMVGDPNQKISGILIALDPTEDLLDEAIASNINTIITHHPLIFNPITNIRTDQPLGRTLQKALKNNIAVIGCHTNLDAVPGGVNDVLATELGLTDLQPLYPSKNANHEIQTNTNPAGLGRIGHFSPPLDGKSLINQLLNSLDIKAVRIVGNLPEQISTAAVCGGSGSDLAETAFNLGAQVYITSELRHSVARWAEVNGFCMLDAGHFATENIVIPAFTDALQKAFTAKNFTTDIKQTTKQGNPFRYCTKINESIVIQ